MRHREGVRVVTHVQVALRDVDESDLELLFAYQRDEDANRMAAFTVKDPHDRSAFNDRWSRILADEAIVTRTVLADDAVAGHVSAYPAPDLDGLEVTYWIGRAFWGDGVATRAVRLFLETVSQRPLYARCAETNPASLRVLHKCGFKLIGEDAGYANAHAREVHEYVMRLDT
jgi:RimJ/RimL family protein N-acetyltransferase